MLDTSFDLKVSLLIFQDARMSECPYARMPGCQNARTAETRKETEWYKFVKLLKAVDSLNLPC